MEEIEILIGIALFIYSMTCTMLLYNIRGEIRTLKFKYEIMKENYDIMEIRYNAIHKELALLRANKLRKQLYEKSSTHYPILFYTLPIKGEDPNLLKLHIEWKDREHKRFINETDRRTGRPPTQPGSESSYY